MSAAAESRSRSASSSRTNASSSPSQRLSSSPMTSSIDSERLSVDDIAEKLSIDKRTFYRDINKAMEDMAVLLFGIEAIGSWKHGGKKK